MVKNYTAKYTNISAGYMGQLVEWPEVITEGKTLEECREMLKDALNEMILAYKQQGKEIPAQARPVINRPIFLCWWGRSMKVLSYYFRKKRAV